jgi:ABC-type lipopolysaccharide export system ATPase subunit
MVRVDILKKEHPELLKVSEDYFSSLTEHDRAVEEKGIEKTRTGIAKKLIKNPKLSDQEIADVSGLSLAEVEKLRK